MVTCPVCDSADTNFFHQFTNYEKPFYVQKCLSCDSLFQIRLPKNVDKFYDHEYYEGKADFSYQDDRKNFSANRLVYQARLKNIRKFKKSGNFLDVGCGLGGFVMSAAAFFNTRGLDVSAFAVSAGNQFIQENTLLNFLHPPKIYQGSLTQLPKALQKEKFDVITLIEVAEHLQDPRQVFEKSFQLLKPGGLLLIQTANFEGWQAVNEGVNYHYFMPGHLVYYTANGLKTLLQQVGFSRFKEYFPVDFGLWPKLRKTWRLSSQKTIRKTWKTSIYHLRSKLSYKRRPLTSSYVLYSFKDQ